MNLFQCISNNIPVSVCISVFAMALRSLHSLGVTKPPGTLSAAVPPPNFVKKKSKLFTIKHSKDCNVEGLKMEIDSITMQNVTQSVYSYAFSEFCRKPSFTSNPVTENHFPSLSKWLATNVCAKFKKTQYICSIITLAVLPIKKLW